MSEETVKNRRKLKNVLINPAYQIRYVFWLGITGLLLTLVNCTIFYVYIHENYSILVELVPMTDQVKGQLYTELHQIIWILAGISVVFVGVVSVLGLFLSHRTAGPMYHMKRVFSDITSGKTTARVNLRPNDDFQDVALAFNTMMDSVTGGRKS